MFRSSAIVTVPAFEYADLAEDADGLTAAVSALPDATDTEAG